MLIPKVISVVALLVLVSAQSEVEGGNTHLRDKRTIGFILRNVGDLFGFDVFRRPAVDLLGPAKLITAAAAAPPAPAAPPPPPPTLYTNNRRNSFTISINRDKNNIVGHIPADAAAAAGLIPPPAGAAPAPAPAAAAAPAPAPAPEPAPAPAPAPAPEPAPAPAPVPEPAPKPDLPPPPVPKLPPKLAPKLEAAPEEPALPIESLVENIPDVEAVPAPILEDKPVAKSPKAQLLVKLKPEHEETKSASTAETKAKISVELAHSSHEKEEEKESEEKSSDNVSDDEEKPTDLHLDVTDDSSVEEHESKKESKNSDSNNDYSREKFKQEFHSYWDDSPYTVEQGYKFLIPEGPPVDILDLPKDLSKYKEFDLPKDNKVRSLKYIHNIKMYGKPNHKLHYVYKNVDGTYSNNYYVPNFDSHSSHYVPDEKNIKFFMEEDGKLIPAPNSKNLQLLKYFKKKLAIETALDKNADSKPGSIGPYPKKYLPPHLST